MDPRVESFMRRPAYQRALSLIVLLVAVVAGFYFGLYEGQLKQVETLGRNLETVNSKLAQNQLETLD